MAFHADVPHAVDVRDMLEHFDEYLDGKGKLQIRGVDEEFLVYFGAETGAAFISVRGHRVGVATSFEALSQLVDALS